MNLPQTLLNRLSEPGLTPSQEAEIRCELAKELEQSGNYQGAAGALGDLWRGIGETPDVGRLDRHARGAVFSRTGALTGWLGSEGQVEGSQESAKNLLSRSISAFGELGDRLGVAEARLELAYCYYREAAYDEARVVIEEVLSSLTDEDAELRAVALIRRAALARATTRLRDALRIIREAAEPVGRVESDSIKGRFHVEMATLLEHLGNAEGRQDYIDQALIEFAAAAYHFERAGHTRYRAAVENNLAFLFCETGRYEKAHEHVDAARRLFISLRDKVHQAQTNDTRARIMLGEGRVREALKAARFAVTTLEVGGHQGLLAEALVTYGVALARAGRHDEARARLRDASRIAQEAGDPEGAGRAELALAEELLDRMPAAEGRAAYARADSLLARTQSVGVMARLRAVAARLVAAADAPREEFTAAGFLHADPATDELLRRAFQYATADSPLLITGETGTGKEVLARTVHQWSRRRGRFVAVNCAALPADLFESQVFGHTRGSFTGATADNPGLMREAEGGTLFLDEIGELSPANQAKLLRALESGEVQPLGAESTVPVDVRVVAATNKDLPAMLAGEKFRQDLYYRIARLVVTLPPLRERPEDTPVLAAHFLRQANAVMGKGVEFPPETMEALKRLPLPGNARELRSLIERTVISAEPDSVVGPERVEWALLTPGGRGSGLAREWEGVNMPDEVLAFEANLIRLALHKAKNSVTEAARLLGLTHQALGYMLQTRHKSLRPASLHAGRRKRSIIKGSKKSRKPTRVSLTR